MTIVKIEGADDVLRILKSLPKEVVSRRGGPVRAALRKGAVVVFQAAQMNLYRVTSNTSTGDDEGTGLLLKNLVVTRGKEPVGTKGERYLVRVRRKSYQRKGQAVTTLKTANLLEYGSSQQPAEPWLRPAFSSTARRAIDVSVAELLKSLDRIVRKLGRQGGLS